MYSSFNLFVQFRNSGKKVSEFMILDIYQERNLRELMYKEFGGRAAYPSLLNQFILISSSKYWSTGRRNGDKVLSCCTPDREDSLKAWERTLWKQGFYWTHPSYYLCQKYSKIIHFSDMVHNTLLELPPFGIWYTSGNIMFADTAQQFPLCTPPNKSKYSSWRKWLSSDISHHP